MGSLLINEIKRGEELKPEIMNVCLDGKLNFVEFSTTQNKTKNRK